MGNDKNMSFLVIPKSSKVGKKVEKLRNKDAITIHFWNPHGKPKNLILFSEKLEYAPILSPWGTLKVNMVNGGYVDNATIYMEY